MKRLFVMTLVVGFLVSVLIGPTFSGWDPGEEDAMRKEAEATVAQFKMKDPGIKRFFDNAYGYAVYPKVGSGAFIIGAAHGSGLVYERGKIVGKSSLSQGSVGLQAGGQSYSEIVFFENKAALNSLKDGKMKFAAQASAVALTAGASANADYSNGVAVFTMGEAGLMLQASIGGQDLTFEPK